MNPKSDILSTPAAHHGAFDYAELARLGLSPDEVIDFSVNSNPYGPPPGVVEAIARVPLDRYPDRECLALRSRLAETHGIEIGNIVVGNGTAELLLLVALAFMQRGDAVLIVEPTFGEYERVSSLVGANVVKHNAGLEQINENEIAQVIHSHRPRVVFWCTPNNPTGIAHDIRVAGSLIERFPDVLFVVDEAYIHFLDPALQIPGDSRLIQPNVLLLRSLTKDYALAGLRLGYAVGPRDLIEALRRVRPAWNVNALAQAAGLEIVKHPGWLRETVARLHANKVALTAGLVTLGLSPLPSAVHYFLINVGDAAQFRQKLLAHKVMVRDCASFGLPACVRVSTRTPEDNARLLEAIARVRDAG